MIKLLDAYKNDEVLFSSIIGSLEGALDAGEFKDKEFFQKWYDLWGPLETYNAIKLDEQKPPIKEEIISSVGAMYKFLVEKLENQDE
jgi:hypothetical protein